MAGVPTRQIEIAGLLAASLGSWIDFWIIFALLMTNATLGFVEEMNAQASIAALKDGLVRKVRRPPPNCARGVGEE